MRFLWSLELRLGCSEKLGSRHGLGPPALARYRSEGDTAFEPRSRRPQTSPTRISDETVELITNLRRRLVEQGLDAGCETITWHLATRHQLKVGRLRPLQCVNFA